MNKRDVKFFKFLILLLFLVVSNVAYSQDYNDFFTKGERCVSKREYKLAIKYFTKAIEIRNTKEAHFNRGVARFRVDDKEGLYYDIEQSKLLLDVRAKKLFNIYCCEIDTIENNSNELILESTHKNNNFKETIIYSKATLDTIVYYKENNQKIYTQLKRKPQYSTGENAMDIFLAKNVIYPREAMVLGVQGTVIASCIIDTNGNVTNVDIITKRHPLLDNATKDVISKIGKFAPAFTNEGLAVPYKLIIPMKFFLEWSKR